MRFKAFAYLILLVAITLFSFVYLISLVDTFLFIDYL